MIYFYVPFDAPDLVALATGAAGDNPVFVHGRHQIRVRPDHVQSGALFIVAHGGFNSGSVIGGVVDGNRRTLTAIELAEQINMDDLPHSWGDIRLLVCWGGYTGGSVDDWTVAGVGTAKLTRDAREGPFAGQLCSALKREGYYRMIVTGYRGATSFTRNVVYSEGKGGASDRQEPDGDPLMRPFFDLNSLGKGKHDRPLHSGAPTLTLKLDSESRTVWY